MAPPPGREPMAGPGRPGPRDEDDTGEILDDTWDGGWGRDPHWPDRWPDRRPERPEELWDERDRDERMRHDEARLPAPGVARGPEPPSVRRRVATAVAVVALLTALAGLLVGVLRDDGPEAAEGTFHEAWGHRFVVPDGWVEAGGDEASRRVLLRPQDDPEGVELIAVQSAPLPADVAEDPDRVRAEIYARYQRARAAGDPVSDMRLSTVVGGRDATRYRQRVAPGVGLDWVVVSSGGDQVSVGCRTPDDGSGGSDEPVPAACEALVASLESTD